MKKLYWTAAGLYFAALPVGAGGYNPVPETAEVVFPESDGNAGIAAAVVFGVIFLIGIIQIATRKRQNRGRKREIRGGQGRIRSLRMRGAKRPAVLAYTRRKNK